MMTLEEFKSQFVFNPANTLKMGGEREFFIANSAGIIVPRAETVLSQIGVKQKRNFTYELSACQVEHRTNVSTLEQLEDEFIQGEQYLEKILRKLELELLYIEVAPETMPLVLFPDPDKRYAEKTKDMPREVILAACRVAGTHFHVGMPDHETARRVFNHVIKKFRLLCAMGDKSRGERLKLYAVVKGDSEPKPYESWVHFHRVALAGGFARDSKDCWLLIRITKHGTIEFRMFGVSSSIPEVMEWARFCHGLCAEVI